MKHYRIAMGIAALAAAAAARAGSFSVTPTLATDYDFRGYSQTDPIDQDGKFAFQVGGTYNFDNGFYLGAWGSNVDDSIQSLGIDGDNIEVDYYGGYSWGDSKSGFGYDAGLNWYTYPGLSDANTVEAYFGLSHSFYSAKIWYTPDYASSSNSGFYIEGNAKYPLPVVPGVSVLAHIGHAFGDAYDEPVDYSLGVGYSVNQFDFAVKYVDGSKDIQGRLIASVSTTLPWSE